MTNPPSYFREDLQQYHRVLTRSVAVGSHFEALMWLQGELQQYLPHEVLIAVWGDFSTQEVQHDILSTLPGLRTQSIRSEAIVPALCSVFKQWRLGGQVPLALDAGRYDLDALQPKSDMSTAHTAGKKMRGVLAHGIVDERGRYDCLYLALKADTIYGEAELGTMSMVMPYIDMALRQVAHLPHQTGSVPLAATSKSLPRRPQDSDITDREAEILDWVSAGKTNSEIGSILKISAFTVKNHLQRISQKLDVSNRAQAVAKYNLLIKNE